MTNWHDCRAADAYHRGMKRFAAILGLFAALSLGGCGGGLYIGWGDYGDTIAPSVSTGCFRAALR